MPFTFTRSPPIKDERRTKPEGLHRCRPLCSAGDGATDSSPPRDAAQLLQICRLWSLGIPFESNTHYEASLTFLSSRGLG